MGVETEEDGGVATARREGEELRPLPPATRTDPDSWRSTFAGHKSQVTSHKSSGPMRS